VGDGELRDELRASPEARRLGDRLTWAGFRRDMPDMYFASDLVVQTSDNEGTPVSLIEAQAAAVPVVSTRVGGVGSVIREGETGLVVSVDDEVALATAVRELLADVARARNMGPAGRRHATDTFSLERLISDIDALYRRGLRDAGVAIPASAVVA
jgi:glycosyltransferase involved in cell wall biosynthesis